MLEILENTASYILDNFYSIPEDKIILQDAFYARDVIRYCLDYAVTQSKSNLSFPIYPNMVSLNIQEMQEPVVSRKLLLNPFDYLRKQNKKELQHIQGIADDLFEINKCIFDLHTTTDHAKALEYMQKIENIITFLHNYSVPTTPKQEDRFLEAIRMTRLFDFEADKHIARPLNEGELDLVAKYKPFKPEVHLAIFNHAKIHRKNILSETLKFIAEHTDNEQVIIEVIKHPLFDEDIAAKVASTLKCIDGIDNWKDFQEKLRNLIESNKKFLPFLGEYASFMNKPETFSPSFAASLSTEDKKHLSVPQKQAANNATRKK